MIKKVRSSDYFDLYEVEKNVYAAIKTNPLCMGNAGFVNLGDRVVIFDTFLSLEAAKLLKKIVVDITGIDNFIIVNSHSHLDHYLGNSVFSEKTPIITSELAFYRIIENSDEIELGVNLYTEEINKLQNKLKTLEDPNEILNTENSLIIYQNLNHKECKFLNPNITFKDTLSICGSSDSFHLKAINKSHSEGDIIGTTKNGNVAFVGDLLFIDEHPYIGAGDPIVLKRELYALLNSDFKYFIPGHGPICDKTKIIHQIKYIDSIMSLVKSNLFEADKLDVTDLPKEFHNYSGPSFKWNIKFLSEYLKK